MKNITAQSIFLLVSQSHIPQARLSIPMINKKLNEHYLYIVASKHVYGKINDIITNEQFIDENLILDKNIFDEDYVKHFKSNNRSNWYYQQFLKFSISLMIDCENYVVWDCDTIPLRHIDFIDGNGKYMFNMKTEHHKPYFDVIRKLFPDSKIDNRSFISEYMIFDTNITKELLKTFQNINTTKRFYENVFDVINTKEIFGSGFSEYETYGTYVNTFYPNTFKCISLKTNRCGKHIFGNIPTLSTLENCIETLDLDTISFENWG